MFDLLSQICKELEACDPGSTLWINASTSMAIV